MSKPTEARGETRSRAWPHSTCTAFGVEEESTATLTKDVAVPPSGNSKLSQKSSEKLGLSC